ncbi:MAG: hypothetical protein NZ820_05245 [Dehalococcoidia bacterium]|nr:hypothetical protein [Dehalococcoidia bacterium]HBR65225.1 hypothetical protein [Dehalococcoidia bacterium]
MEITSVEISVFELPMYPIVTQVVPVGNPSELRWQQAFPKGGSVPVQVMQVMTDEGIHGICTVGDWRYTELTWRQIAQLRELVIGEDPLERDLLLSKLKAVSRFFEPGWYGGFDNCLWDIEGKVKNLPVSELLGGAKGKIQAYYNTTGVTPDELILDGEAGIKAGFTVLKDHLPFGAQKNIETFREFRKVFGDSIGLMHDAALVNYTFDEAVQVGKELEDLNFIWLEEPLPDRHHEDYVNLCKQLKIPIAAAETLMNEPEISKLWLKSGAIDILRVNGRHGTTPVLNASKFAALLNTTVEPNAYGPLFGIVHAHINCGISNIDWFENAPPSRGAEMGEEIGLLNPIRPVAGWVTPPSSPGWGAEWDWNQFRKKRIAIL